MPSENTILNLFRRPFSFFNNSTFHYRLRTRRQKAARFRLPKHIMVEHSQPDGLVSCYEYDRYDPLAQVCNWTSMPTVRRGCITTSSGIMSLMRVGLLIRTRLGFQAETICISLRLMCRIVVGHPRPHNEMHNRKFHEKVRDR